MVSWHAPPAPPHPDLDIGRPALRREAGTSVIEADVLDLPLWLRSRDAQLEPLGEVFGSALLLPALGAPRRLRLATPVSAQWMENVERVLALVSRWWGYPRLLPDARAVRRAPPTAAARSGLFFGGGVDALHTLITRRSELDALVFVQGFDIRLDDERRAAAAEASVRAVAAEAGVEPLVVATNLRTHPAHGQSNWERSHGGALAAVGHALSDKLRTVLVSSSNPRSAPAPWGTHWDLDPLWSSERLEFVHHGEGLWRSEKLRAIAGDPLAQRHLRVCWEHLVPGRLNCSRCEKCVRTMLTLSQEGRLGDFEVFDPPAPLYQLLDEVPSASAPLALAYARILETSRDRRERAAIHRLVARAEPG